MVYIIYIVRDSTWVICSILTETLLVYMICFVGDFTCVICFALSETLTWFIAFVFIGDPHGSFIFTFDFVGNPSWFIWMWFRYLTWTVMGWHVTYSMWHVAYAWFGLVHFGHFYGYLVAYAFLNHSKYTCLEYWMHLHIFFDSLFYLLL